MAVEPWLRGTLTDVEAVKRAVLHALELAGEDAARWADALNEAELFERPLGLPSVAFQLLHVARSLDRLLTYAEASQLDEAQMAALRSEMAIEGTAEAVRAEFRSGLQQAKERVQAISPADFAQPRGVGRKMLPTSVAGLLVHSADHTQRHIGQLVTTVKVLRALAGKDQNPHGTS